MKRTIKLRETELKRMIAESVKRVLKEGRKKDPMAQWFKDFDNVSKYRDNMDYIEKGGREPNSHRRNVVKALGKKVDEAINEEFKLYGPSPMTIAELTYNNQDIREHIDAVIQFCEVAADTPEAAGNPNVKNFCKKLYKDLLDFKSHAFFELDGYDEN